MVLFLLILIAGLLVTLIMLLSQRQRKSHELKQISQKLDDVLYHRTAEHVQLHTNDTSFKELIVRLNQLLHDRVENPSAHWKSEDATKQLLIEMSHDLKAPLMAVIGSVEMLSHDRTLGDEERKQLNANVYDKTMDMLQLMNSFFSLSQLELDDAPLPMHPIPLNELCRSSIVYFHESIIAAGFEAIIDIPDKPLYTIGNEEAFTTIVQQLMSNAIRHGGGGATIGLILRQSNQHVYLEIWDRGAGIAEWQLPSILERLYTLDDSLLSANQGNGIGLAITKGLVDKMNGIISVFSKPNRRTVFTVRFPLVSANGSFGRG